MVEILAVENNSLHKVIEKFGQESNSLCNF